jgi:hypothetical protein
LFEGVREREIRGLYVVERMQTHAVTFAKACGMEAGDELADYGAGLAGGD